MSTIKFNDGEMPTDKPLPGADSDGKFHVPSQFAPELDSPEHTRFAPDMILEYHRGEDTIGVIDFSDFAVGPDILEELGEDGLIRQIMQDASLIINNAIEGGLKPGDVQVLLIEDVKPSNEDEPKLVEKSRTVLTEEQIAIIQQASKEFSNPTHS